MLYFCLFAASTIFFSIFFAANLRIRDGHFRELTRYEKHLQNDGLGNHSENSGKEAQLGYRVSLDKNHFRYVAHVDRPRQRKSVSPPAIAATEKVDASFSRPYGSSDLIHDIKTVEIVPPKM